MNRILFKRSEDNSNIYLEYTPADSSWVRTICNSSDSSDSFHLLKGTFHLHKELFILENTENDITTFKFKFAELGKDGYYKIPKSILDTKHDVFIHHNIEFELDFFAGERNISIFPKINKLCDEEIYIGGTHDNAIPKKEFELLIKRFPTAHELNLFAESRITNILQKYLPTMFDVEIKLQNFYEKKAKKLLSKNNKKIIPKSLYETESFKYEQIRDILKEQLNEDDNINESEWQDFLSQFLLLIFPQYVTLLKEVKISESFSKQYKLTTRRMDYILINADGYIDIIELKRPCEDCLLSDEKHRSNYYPKSPLAATVMQAEKYLLYLNGDAVRLEKKLTEDYKNELPEGLNIKIRNPRAKIIMGRSDKFDEDKKSDFEIIKRKYSNIMDIMSYDDILLYLDNIINSLQKK